MSRHLIHPRDEIVQTMQRIYGYRMTTTSGGNLSIRVFRVHQLDVLAENLSAKIEKLGGSLDKQTDRALVYSIHFSIGFQVIEELLSAVIKDYPDFEIRG